VLNYYGYMLGDLGIRLDEAEALVQQALKEDPFNGAYLDSLGWIFSREQLSASENHTAQGRGRRTARTPRFIRTSAISTPKRAGAI